MGIPKKMDYDSLMSSYLRACDRVRQLEEDAEMKSEQWNAYSVNCEVVDKHARKLCEKILAKDKNQMVLGDAKTWHAISTDELISMASESFDKYNSQRTLVINNILAESERRGREIESLKDQIEIMIREGRVGDIQTVEDVTAAAEKRKKDGDTLSKVSFKTQEAFNAGRIDVIIESDDDNYVDGEMNTFKELMNTAEQVRLTSNSIPHIRSAKKEEDMKAAENEVVMTHMVDLKTHIEKCGDVEWQVLHTIGSKGISRYRDIEAEITQDTKFLNASVRNATSVLLNLGALEKDTFKLPISAKSIFYHLSVIGRRLYKYRFNEEPCISEIERVIAEHDNAEHGYGIIDIQRILENNGSYTEVSSYNRDKAIEVTIEDKKYKYIPDLIAKSKKGYTEYFEYERGTHHQSDFNLKIDKMCKVTRFINIVAPNRKIMADIKVKVDAWIGTRDPQSIKNHILRICTANDIKTQAGYPIEYRFSKSLEPIKDIT